MLACAQNEQMSRTWMADFVTNRIKQVNEQSTFASAITCRRNQRNLVFTIGELLVNAAMGDRPGLPDPGITEALK